MVVVQYAPYANILLRLYDPSLSLNAYLVRYVNSLHHVDSDPTLIVIDLELHIFSNQQHVVLMPFIHELPSLTKRQ